MANVDTIIGGAGGGYRFVVREVTLVAGTATLAAADHPLGGKVVTAFAQSAGTDAVGVVVTGKDVAVTSANGADVSVVQVLIVGY